jgi:hypothetical protein
MASKRVELEKTKLDYAVLRWRNLSAIALSLIRYCGAVAFMYFVYRTVNCLSGKQTSAEIAVNGGLSLKFIASRYFSQIVFAIFGSGGILYGQRQKQLYKKATKKLQRLEKYERNIDPNRSSSGLDDGSMPNSEDSL